MRSFLNKCLIEFICTSSGSFIRSFDAVFNVKFEFKFHLSMKETSVCDSYIWHYWTMFMPNVKIKRIENTNSLTRRAKGNNYIAFDNILWDWNSICYKCSWKKLPFFYLNFAFFLPFKQNTIFIVAKPQIEDRTERQNTIEIS